jgi:hypothetical protein
MPKIEIEFTRNQADVLDCVLAGMEEAYEEMAIRVSAHQRAGHVTAAEKWSLGMDVLVLMQSEVRRCYTGLSHESSMAIPSK